MRNIKTIFIFSILLAVPKITFALTYFEDLAIQLSFILGKLAPVVISIAVLIFLWGLMKYIYRTDNPESVESAKSIMVWGVIALFLMVSMWGLVGVLQVAFGVDTDPIPSPPVINM